jgi:hypothetical protein
MIWFGWGGGDERRYLKVPISYPVPSAVVPYDYPHLESFVTSLL